MGLATVQASSIKASIKRETWSRKHQASSIKQGTSSIKHEELGLEHQAPSIKHETSNIKNLRSRLWNEITSIGLSDSQLLLRTVLPFEEQ